MAKKMVVEDEVPGITGLLHTNLDATHQFSAANDCPYFMGSSELCFLSGKLCPHDSITYPACPTYAIGCEKHLPGVKGDLPDVPPAGSLADIEPPPDLDRLAAVQSMKF